MLDSRTDSRLARVMAETEPGVPISLRELTEHFGFSPQLAAHYTNRGLLKRLGSGVYALANEEISIYGALRFLQGSMPGLHVAGKTALAWQGISHNVYLRETTVVWGQNKSGLPKWLRDNFRVRYSSSNIFSFEDEQLDLQTRQPSPFRPLSVYCSCRERALLELLSEVSVTEDWEEARNIFELVTTVREDFMGKLLKYCTSLKTKRLFANWATDTKLVDVPALFTEYGITVGTGHQWKVPVTPGQRTTIKKVSTHASAVSGTGKPSNRNHPALLRIGPAGLKRRNRN